MRHCRDNWIAGTTLEFPRTGFWVVHVIGVALVFLLGMRFAVRRVPLSFAAYRLIRMLSRR
ncbi:MAG TPA: hypothetical protein PKA10_14455 [Selenomonadales bacterium]|nr:hypothetical protein [Selenomonadales bacterium]